MGDIVMHQPNETPEALGYQQAGHAVMSYIIRCGLSLNDEWRPIDLSLVLPPFHQVSIEGPTGDWGETTFSLGSLVTAPQVLLAGVAAQQLYQGQITDTVPPDLDIARKARNLLGGYLSEYSEDTPYTEREKLSMEWLQQIFDHVKFHVQTFWPTVTALASQLIEHKSLTEAEAFEVIETTLTPQQLEKARDVQREYPENFG